MAKWQIPQDEIQHAWEKDDFRFTKEQVDYMNGEVLQKLMKMTEGYDEKHKRAVYEYVIAQLADYSVHAYWQIKHRQRVQN